MLYLSIILIIVSAYLFYLFRQSNQKNFNLQEEIDKLDSVFHSSRGISIIATDKDGFIKIFNNGASEILGYEANELIDKHTPLLFHDNEEVANRAHFLSKKLERPITGFETFIAYADVYGTDNREWTYIKKNGEKLIVDLWVSRIIDKNSNHIGYVGIAKDITDKLKYENKLRDHNKNIQKLLELKERELDSLNNELKAVAYNLSHDIKTPLRGVNQLAGWIKDDYGSKLDEEGIEMLDLLSARVERMNGIVNGILEYSKIRTFLKNDTSVDLNTVINNLLSFMRIPRSFEVTISTGLPTLSIDRNYIEDVFQNIISNSVKYMDKEIGRIDISCEKIDNFYQFAIKDNGPGIDPKYHDKIFKMFQTLNSEDVKKDLGVGLPISKKIIELYGGKMWLESNVGIGTTIFFTLPYA